MHGEAAADFIVEPPLIHGAVRPIRIRCRNQWPPEPQLIEIAPILVYFSGKSMAYYTDRKLKIRILCGSI
jgi:hypothetical protein